MNWITADNGGEINVALITELAIQSRGLGVVDVVAYLSDGRCRTLAWFEPIEGAYGVELRAKLFIDKVKERS